MVASRLPRRWITTAVVCLFIVLFIVFERQAIVQSSAFTYYTRPHDDLLNQQGRFWQLFQADLEQHGPTVSPLTHPEETKLDIFFNSSDHRQRPDFLSMSVAQWEAMGKAHGNFVAKIRSMQYHLPYVPGSRGIVTTAGGPYLPVALVSIRMLRETGALLPVEVFLSQWSEWDPVICGEILPSLNAKCVVMQDIFDYDKETPKSGLHKYQYKVMSILFSSFEEVLFLDSDCFPVHSVDHLFDSEPFNTTGLVLWPDFWFPSESPLFFEIANIQAPSVNEHASTEAGEILYSKRKHELSLLLAAYYNYYGPQYYYPLQSQGAPGEGDKETFLWSAVAMGEPYYAVKQPVHALGYHTKDGEWRGSAMAQFDPVQEQHPDVEVKEAAHLRNQTYPRPTFIHVNFPKLDPGQIFDSSSFGAAGPTRDSDGTLRRIWHKDEDDAVNFFGSDLEKAVWKVVKAVACDYENVILSWKGKKNICKKATDYWHAVFSE